MISILEWPHSQKVVPMKTAGQTKTISEKESTQRFMAQSIFLEIQSVERENKKNSNCHQIILGAQAKRMNLLANKRAKMKEFFLRKNRKNTK